jgi:hypothetical protein
LSILLQAHARPLYFSQSAHLLETSAPVKVVGIPQGGSGPPPPVFGGCVGGVPPGGIPPGGITGGVPPGGVPTGGVPPGGVTTGGGSIQNGSSGAIPGGVG